MEQPAYLRPYLDAVRQHGAGFGALLWASLDTQAARFDAITRLIRLEGRSVLDVGCGRADLLEFLYLRGIFPSTYTGIEAVAALATAARDKVDGRCRIVEGDFVADPEQLCLGAEVIVFCGSLNTMGADTFYAMLRRAHAAASVAVVFNFLCAAHIAAAPHLTWHRKEHVLGFARSLDPGAAMLNDYLDGDCTTIVKRSGKREASSEK